jgi:hypothetical protein
VRTLSFRQSASICIITFSMFAVLVSGGTNPVYAEDSLEQLLSKAMENHPDIVAAKAKVTLAEAELNTTRLQVARQIITLWGNRETQKSIVQKARELDKATPGVIPTLELSDSEAKLHQLETELHYIIGKETSVIPQKKDSQTTPKQLHIPTGPIVEQIRKKFQTGETIQMEFVDAPLSDVIDYLMNYLKIPVYFDLEACSGANSIIASDQPIKMNIRNAPLAAALQYFQDQWQGTQFVIRDYGILLTTIDRAKAQGYYPVLDFAREIEKAKSPEANTPEPTPSNPRKTPSRM